MLLVGKDGEQFGICDVRKALSMAKEQELDLVEVSPHTNPPVCKLLDFGKYKYAMSKKKGKGAQRRQTLKEIRMQPKISSHDLGFKTRHIQSFLEEGDKVKVSVRFRGRELSYTELGKEVLNRILNLLTCDFIVEREAKMEGRMMSVMLSPSSKSKSSKLLPQKEL